jgi:prephenate dehydrogenase
VARIPGKHGAVAQRYHVVAVLVPDQPGELGRLFADIGAAEVNIEEVRLEHAPGRAVGLVELSVLPADADPVEAALTGRGWQLVG